PSGSPEAMHSWFYPGEIDGVQFVYPKSERQYIAETEQPAAAAATSQPAVPPQLTTSELAETGPAPLLISEEEEVIVAQAAPAPTVTESAPTNPPPMLPRTAGNFAVIPLLGIALLSGGFTAIRVAARQNN